MFVYLYKLACNIWYHGWTGMREMRILKKREEAYIYYTEISPSNYAMLHPTHILSYFPGSTESLCC